MMLSLLTSLFACVFVMLLAETLRPFARMPFHQAVREVHLFTALLFLSHPASWPALLRQLLRHSPSPKP